MSPHNIHIIPEDVSQERYNATHTARVTWARLIENLDAFPSSSAFDLISSALSSSDAERKDAVKKGGAIFAFTLKNTGAQESWYIDLKETGVVGKGEAPEGKKADGMHWLAPNTT